MSTHKVRVTKKGDVVVDGVKYIAVPPASDDHSGTCPRCAFRKDWDLCGAVPCTSWPRADGCDVYFEVKPRKAVL